MQLHRESERDYWFSIFTKIYCSLTILVCIMGLFKSYKCGFLFLFPPVEISFHVLSPLFSFFFVYIDFFLKKHDRKRERRDETDHRSTGSPVSYVTIWFTSFLSSIVGLTTLFGTYTISLSIIDIISKPRLLISMTLSKCSLISIRRFLSFRGYLFSHGFHCESRCDVIRFCDRYRKWYFAVIWKPYKSNEIS